MTSAPPSEPVLDEGQFRRLATYGVPQEVAVGDELYATGDASYDLILLETASVDIVRDATASEAEHVVTRRSPGDFLGELSLLTGQAVYLTARVTVAGRIVRIDTETFRRLLSEQVDIADVLLEAFSVRRDALKEAAGSALELVGWPTAVETRELRAYVGRLGLPHSWFEAGSVAGHALMAAIEVSEADLPAVVVAGRVLRTATPGEVAEVLGLTYRQSVSDVDLVVVGAGPAGLAAAVYGASEGLVTVLLDAAVPGGQAGTSSRIENYLGFPQGISGDALARLAMVQALKFGTQIYAPCRVEGLEVTATGPVLRLVDGTEIRTRAVIVTSGARYRRLDVPGWDEFEERGCVHYSATELDVRGYESQPVAVIGGANSAGQAALFLASRGSHVDLVVRRDDIRATMSSYLVDRLEVHPMVRIRTASNVLALEGRDRLMSVVVGGPDGDEKVECHAVFCFVGADPATDWLTGVELDEDGFVLTDVRLGPDAGADRLPFQTNLPGVFAAGDVRAGSMKRVAAAVGEGASAVASVHVVLGRQVEGPRT
ncbi:FAD-dependent oxidoreductase [Nocardioides conyzicola]|uniref:FAD-dependent oxidoreductase n=1 Tax=Nocardioides conyzicola TaxID=1651781 RepID=A0ABP8XWY7_9ACTN